MVRKSAIIATIGVSIGLISSGAIAQTMREHDQSTPTTSTSEFQRIEQPLSNKLLVTVGGLSLIGLELWWFLFSKPKALKAETQGGIQSVNIVVNGGYELPLLRWTFVLIISPYFQRGTWVSGFGKFTLLQ